jgi:hypothetical protein
MVAQWIYNAFNEQSQYFEPDDAIAWSASLTAVLEDSEVGRLLT